MILCDVLIIGGGPSGSIAAANLSQKGFSVEVIEKLTFPRFVIGESLLPHCNAILAKNNLLDRIIEQGYIVKAGAIFERENTEKQIYHFRENIGEPYNTAFQVKREEFDHVLLQGAESFGANVKYEVEVTDYNQDENKVLAKDKEGNVLEYKAKFVLDCSGYGRVLTRLLDLEIPSEFKTRKAIFTRVQHDIRPKSELDGYITIYVHGNNEAWIWVIPFVDGTTSVGVVCTDAYYDKHHMKQEAFWDYIIDNTPKAKERLKNATKLQEVDKIDGYASNVKTMYGKGFALAGNATEFLDPVFSSGVTLAMVSGDLAADCIAKELQGENIDWQHEYEEYMMEGIDVFREFVLAWYDGRLHKIFFSNIKNEAYTRSISSILSGYVWNKKNVFVERTKDKINLLIKMINATS